MMHNELTQEEQTVRDLAVEHMKEQGREIKVRYIASYGEYIYMVAGEGVCPDCGVAHDSIILMYMRIPSGFVLLPKRSLKRVDLPEMPDLFEAMKRLLNWGGDSPPNTLV